MTPTSRSRAGLLLGAAALAIAGSAPAVAAPLAADGPTPAAPSGVATFDATVNVGNGCSGAIVRFPGSVDTDPALILSNGHCLPGVPGDPGPGRYHADKPLSMKAAVYAGERADEVGTLDVDRLVYATTTGTDIEILRTTKTYAQVASELKVKARTISSTRPAAGATLSAPSGFWRHEFTCKVAATVPTLKEGKWVWKDSIAYADGVCGGYRGSSGSPLVDRSTGQVVGLHNTMNDDGASCTINNPCEVDASGKTVVVKGRGYGQQVDAINSCLDAGRRFDVKTPGCRLTGGPAATGAAAGGVLATTGTAPLKAEGQAVTAAASGATATSGGVHGQVVGGKDAAATLGAVRVFSGAGSICTGSLIAPNWALTAKHCLSIYANKPRHFAVRIGSLDPVAGGYLVPVEAIHSRNDMALFKLAWTSFSDEKPVTLASADPAVGSRLVIRGWGYTQNSGGLATRLQEGTMKVDSVTSRDVMGGPGISATGDPSYVNKGDSGGPAFVDGVQVGVTSGGVMAKKWSVFGSIPRNRDWIRQTSGV